MKKDFTDVDGAILAAIKDGCVRFNEIVARTDIRFRVVDRRLQAMRRARKITFSTTYGWGIRD